MKVHRVVLLVLSIALALPAMGAAQAQGRLSGQVNDDKGQPIEGVKVTLRSEDVGLSIEETTNRKGKFTIAVVDATKQFVLTLEKEGFAPLSESIKLPVGGILRRTWTLGADSGGAAAAAAAAASEPLKGSKAAIAAFNEGVLAFKEGDYEVAEAKFGEAAQLDPELLQAKQILGALVLERKDYARAEVLADEILVAKPGDTTALTLRLDALTGLGRKEEADAALDALMAVDKSPPTAVRLFNAGVAALKAQDLDRAVTRFEQAAAADPTLKEAPAALAELYVSRRQWDKALASAERVLALDPSNVKGLAARYDAYRGMGDTARADEAFKVLSTSAPEAVAEGYYKRGEELFNAGQNEEAIDALEKVLLAKPDHARAHYRLGLAYASAGDVAKARQHLQRFLELAPEDPEAPSAQEMLKYLK